MQASIAEFMGEINRHLSFGGMVSRKLYDEIFIKALNGETEAQFYLGLVFAVGKYGYLGYKLDYGFAKYWLEQASKQSLPQAQWALAVMFINGYGCKIDTEQGLKWYRRCAKLYHDSGKAFKSLDERVFPPDFTDAQIIHYLRDNDSRHFYEARLEICFKKDFPGLRGENTSNNNHSLGSAEAYDVIRTSDGGSFFRFNPNQ